MPRLRRWRWAAVGAFIALLALPAMPGGAGSRVLAHAQLVASSPSPGTILEEPPTELRLVFSEPLESQVTSLDLVAQDGTELLVRAGEIDPDDPYALVATAPELADGVYSITWRTLSAADGHTIEGFFTFGVGEIEGGLPPVGPGSAHAETDAIGVLGRWLTYIGLLLAIGLAAFHRFVIRNGPMPVALVRLIAAGLAVSAVATLATAVGSAVEAGAGVDYLLGTRNGALQLARAAVAALGAISLLVAPRRWTGALAAATGLIGVVLLAAAGHAAALPGPVPVISQAVHVIAAGIWIGGLAGLLMLLVAPAVVSEEGRIEMRSVVPRFSALALGSIGMVVLTGAYAAWMEMGALLDVDTEYGRTLLMKAGLVAGALALGSLNYFDGGRMRPWLDGFRTRLSVEVMVAASVLLMTAVLATTPPIHAAGGVAIEPVPDAFGVVAPQMEMHVVPGRPGVNRVVVTTTDALASAAGMELGLDRLDTGTSTRVPLVLEGTHGMGGMEGMDHAGMVTADGDGSVDWTADALILPAGSDWSTSVRILASDGSELSRQRFDFVLGPDGISEGVVQDLLNPATLIAIALALGGALGIGLGLGGFIIPRCEALASRVALVGGGVTAMILGLLMGINELIA